LLNLPQHPPKCNYERKRREGERKEENSRNFGSVTFGAERERERERGSRKTALDDGMNDAVVVASQPINSKLSAGKRSI
jgi:hypothetical protein